MELKNRYEFVMLFDCENGNPNGDPDAGNMPRVDAETMKGFITDVCIKRKIRNYIDTIKNGFAGYAILIKNDKLLNDKFTDAYKACNLKLGQKGKNQSDVVTARDYICKNYFDVRTFGAVMNTGDDPCGIVRGPVQINFAQSIDAIEPKGISITRQARTKEDNAKLEDSTFGKKNFIPYGLYRAEGYVSSMLANKTGFSEEDLELLFKAIVNMFEIDHSAARGKMCMRKLYVFKHESALGNAPSWELFDKIKVTRKGDVETPRKFSDYDVEVDKEMPNGVTPIEKL